MRALSSDQEEAVNKLTKFKVGALFMEAGTGKTQTASTLINTRKDINKVLWFTPFRSKNNLRIELDKCNLKYDVEIIGIESISNSDRLFLRLYNKYKNEKFFCIVDESLKIKNISKRTDRITKIGAFAKYRLILNGTPLSKNYLDLFYQFNFLSPKILKMNNTQFYNTFVIEKNIYKNDRLYKTYIEGFDNLEYLFNLISPFIYECSLKLDVNKTEENVHYIIDDDELECYKRLKNKLIDSIKKSENKTLMYLQKMQHSYCLNSSKIRTLNELLSKLYEKGNKKEDILIYCKYINEQEFLKKSYPDIKVLSLGKHSFALNLQSHNIIIFFNRHWDYALIEQATRRIYRTGQTRDCYIYNLIGNVGLDYMIDENLDKKETSLNKFKTLLIKEIEENL